MINSISILVGLKNNLVYSKHFYETTRHLYPQAEIVFVSFGSTDGTHGWLDSLQDEYLVYYYSNERKTFSDTYNKAIELATKPYVLFAHNDMVLGAMFMENMNRHVVVNRVISYVTAEPPVFPDDARDQGKMIWDFGFGLSDFRLEDFYKKVQETLKEVHDGIKKVNKISFFLCTDRQLLLNIGGFDPLFAPMFREDDDLIIRLKLAGAEFYLALDVISYHFVSKTSRFSSEYAQTTKLIEERSNRNFIRKWGFPIHSAVQKKYDIGFVIKNCNLGILELLEPYCSQIYVDIDYTNFLNVQQAFTRISLKEKVKPYDSLKKNGILIYFDGKKVNDEDISKLRNIGEVIYHSPNKKFNLFQRWILGRSVKNFRTGRLKVIIHDNTSEEYNLIYRR